MCREIESPEEIGNKAEAILPTFWSGAPRCDARKLRDSIETEAANAAKAARLKNNIEERLQALEERLSHDA